MDKIHISPLVKKGLKILQVGWTMWKMCLSIGEIKTDKIYPGVYISITQTTTPLIFYFRLILPIAQNQS